MMLWISLGLLGLFALIVFVNYRTGRFSMANWQVPRRSGVTMNQHLENMTRWSQLLWHDAGQVQFAVLGAVGAALHEASPFFVFSNRVIFFIFATFLLPLWTLSFATEGLGRPREAGNLAWLLTRPLPRSSVYLATFLAALPWCLALNVGGLWLLCAMAGDVGALAFSLYWPGVFWGTLAFASLFHLMGACVRRPGLTALLYAMFLETLAGNLPREFKRLSISYYMRCMMFDSAHDYGIRPENPSIYVPVSGTTAVWMLALITTACLLVGMWIFSRREYGDVGV